MLTTQDANSAAYMGVSMNLVHANTKIQRTVTRLPDGIKISLGFVLKQQCRADKT